MTRHNYKYPDNFAIALGEHVAQDVFYKNDYIYIILSEKDGDEYNLNHILKFNYTSGEYIGHDTFKNDEDIKFEIESMYIDSNNNLIFSANESYMETVNNKSKKVNGDGIYKVENWGLAKK